MQKKLIVSARLNHFLMLALVGFILGISSPSAAYWTPGGAITGETPDAACYLTIQSINASLPPESTWQWAKQNPYIVVSSEYPGGYYSCKVKPVDKTTGTDISYPPATGYTLYIGCMNTDEVIVRDYSQITGCAQINFTASPALQGNGCPAGCGQDDATGMSIAASGQITTGSGGVTGAGTVGDGNGIRNLMGAARAGSTASTSTLPVDIASGNAFYSTVDYESAGPNKLVFARFYNSLEAPSSATSLGISWRHSFDRYITAPNASSGTVERADGKKFTWSGCGSGSCALGVSDLRFTLYRTANGTNYTYTLVTPEDTVETYTAPTNVATAQLQSITFRNGYTLTLDRSTANQLKVTDSYGRMLTLNFNTNGVLQSLNTPDSTTISYGYNTEQFMIALGNTGNLPRLASVTYPDAPSNPVTYAYAGIFQTFASGVSYYISASNEPIVPFHLLSVTDQNGNKLAQWTYDKFGRATSSKGYNSTRPTTISYDYTNGQRTVTESSGVADVYGFVSVAGLSRFSYINRPAVGSTPATRHDYAYDANGFLYAADEWYTLPWNDTSRLDYYTVNSRGLPTQMLQDYSHVANRITANYTWATQAATAAYPAGYVYRLPASVTEGIAPASPSGMVSTSYTYDSKGNTLTKTLTDLSGQGQPARTWTYTYDATGNVLTAQDPRGNTTTFTYTNGVLASITNALSQTVTFSNFTGGGRPQTVTDANGVVHSLTYDSRQRLTSSSVTVGGVARTTTYTWNLNDEIQKILNPDGTFITYGYPYEVNGNALTRTATDAAGNQLVTTMDGGLRPVTVKTQDSGGTVALHRNATYDVLGRTATESNFDNTKTTTYNYDLNSNVTSVVDPLSHTTSFAYDLYHRRTSMTDANGGVTSWTYNALHDVASVTAPATTGSPSPTTTFTRNGFGEVKQEVSPDRGTTSYVYDNMGNLTQKTDAAGVVTNYTYDALNRLKTVAYPSNTALNVTYNYDEAGHGRGVGRLTSVTDPSGTRSLSYDERGAVTADNRVISGTSYPTSYSYNPAGRLAGITYPAGAAAGYTYNTAGRVATVTSTPSGGSATTVANYAAGYLPFGPPKGVTLGNGIVTSYSYDKDLNLLTILSNNSTQNLTYAYDNAGNLTNITDTLTPANSQTLSYDVINRITGATSGAGGYGTLAYAWDKNANRTSHTVAGTTTPYTTATGTNRLTNLGAQAVTTNGNGSVTGFSPAQPSGLATLAYNAAGRVATASSASATLLTNTYDATGMRAQKVAGSTTSRFVRGLSAELLQEVTGTTRRNYIYANGLPIAQLNGTTLHYLHTDQRGAPTVATNASKTVRWSTRYDPFGATIGLTNPGSLVMNLRLPGQYADSETGLYDNGFRTYNPATGRYLQSDPIGLNGGTNTYGYVGGQPFTFVDPLGLAPGDMFKTPDEAACDVLNYINPTSIKQNLEYAGSIKQDPQTGQYYATWPYSGNGHEVGAPAQTPDTAGIYHTHGNYSIWGPEGTIIPTGSFLLDDFDADNFSFQDKAIIEGRGASIGNPDFPGYLGTPSGGFKKYSYSELQTNLDCECNAK